MQKIIICGNLTVDPTLNTREWTNPKTGAKEKASICNFTVAVDDGFGEKKRTDYFRVNIWKEFGQKCAEVLKKGYQVLVWGTVSVSQYTTNAGKTYATMELHAEGVQFLYNKSDKPENTEVNVQSTRPVLPPNFGVFTEEDMPF